MPDQAWLDYLVANPTHQGTTEARLDNVVVAPVHQGLTEGRLDALTVSPTHQGTTEGRLDALYVFVSYAISPPTAIVPDITGYVGVPTQFDGSGSLNTISYVWNVLSVPGGSTTAFPVQALSDNGADGIVSMLGNTLLLHCDDLPDDTSGSGAAVALTALSRQALGIVGDAFQATSANSYIDVSPGVPVGAGDFTISMWFFNLGSDGRWRTGTFNPAGTDYQFLLDPSQQLGLWTGGAFHATDTGFTMSAATYTGWHHIAVVGSGADTLFYVDGVYVGRVVGFKVSAAITRFAGDTLSDPWLDAGGRVDEVAVWQRALSAAEITALYGGGSPTALADFGGSGGPVSMTNNVFLLHCDGLGLTDTSGTSNNASLNAGVSKGSVAGKVGTYAIGTSGTQPLVQPVLPLATAGDFTLSCWFFGLEVDSAYRTLGGSNSELILTEITTTRLGLWVGGSFHATDTLFAMPAASYTGWHHLAAVGSGSNTLFYVDGVHVGTVLGVKPTTALDHFGSNSVATGQRFAARLDEIAFWTRALDPHEVLNLYNRSGGVGSTLPITADVLGTYQVQLTTIGGVGPSSTVVATAVMAERSGQGPFPLQGDRIRMDESLQGRPLRYAE